MPIDLESIVMLTIFNNTPFVYSGDRIIGLNYKALKDQIRWNGLSSKVYVNKLHTCVNYFINGINKRA